MQARVRVRCVDGLLHTFKGAKEVSEEACGTWTTVPKWGER
jgi:hypothetical protein